MSPSSASFLAILAILAALLPVAQPYVDCDVAAVNAESRLRKELLCKYDRSVIPVRTTGTKITIAVKMVLKGLNYNEHDNTLDVTNWLSLSWPDEFLRWKPSDYDGIDRLVESSELIWQPDLSHFNPDVNSIEAEFCKATSCEVSSDGTVKCIPPCLNTARCFSDYRRWPFDVQNCSLVHGMWMHDGNNVDFQLQEPHVPREVATTQNREWQLRVATYKYEENRIGNTTYPNMEYSFYMERHSGTHAIVLVAPAMVIVLINLLQMWLSPACVERLALVSVNMFFHFFYMQQLMWQVPSNGDVVPLVVRFFETSMWLTVALLVLAVGSRGLHQAQFQVPAWIATAVAYFKSLRCGRFCLDRSYLIENQPLNGSDFGEFDANEEAAKASTANLSEVQINDPNPSTTATAEAKSVATSSSSEAWRTIVRLIDRVLFVVLLLVYGLMMFEWLPEGYLTSSKLAPGNVKVVQY